MKEEQNMLRNSKYDTEYGIRCSPPFATCSPYIQTWRQRYDIQKSI